jgi:hypothetical protein
VTATVPAVPTAETPDLAEALRRAGVAEVDAGARRRAEYSSDASNYRVVPAAVVFPRDADDVAATLAVSRDLELPVTSRGSGTSIAGNAIGSGIVLDFSRHLNAVLEVRPEEQVAVVQPGAILDAITAAAQPHGLRFGPDPSTHSRASIGGTIGNNACGSRALGYGRTSNNVIDLDVLTADGLAFTARRYGRDGLSGQTGPQAALLSRLNDIVAARMAMIRTEFGRFTRQVSGYSMEQLLPENGVDLAKFLVGTEGSGSSPKPPSGWFPHRRRSPWSSWGTRTCRPRPRPSPVCCRTRRSPWKEWTPGWSMSSAGAGARRPCRICREGRGGCSPRRSGRPWLPPRRPDDA